MSSREPTSVAEAEDEAARAQERAEAARARATRLRQLAEVGAARASGEGPSDQRDPNDTEDVTELDAVNDSVDEAEPPPAKSAGIVARLRKRVVPATSAVVARIIGRLRRPSRNAVVVAAMAMLICASLVVSGLMLWQHRTIMDERQRKAEFAAAARRGVTMLMSIDANHAKEDFQHIIDDSTGQLKNQLEVTALPLAAGVEQSKVSTKVTVNAAAVLSMTKNSAVVLVAAKSDRTSPHNTPQPGLWRILVSIDRDGGQLKMSKVEFLP